MDKLIGEETLFPIPTFDGYYITKSGQVYSCKKSNKPKRLKFVINRYGYVAYTLVRNKPYHTFLLMSTVDFYSFFKPLKFYLYTILYDW